METSEIEFLAPTPALIRALAFDMREGDRLEIEAGLGLDPLETIYHSIQRSEASVTLILHGEVGGMFGVGPSGDDGIGVVWGLTGNAAGRHRKAFLKGCRYAVDGILMASTYRAFANMVDARYAAALRWAKWLGFEVGSPQAYGVLGLPFHPILLRRSAWAAS